MSPPSRRIVLLTGAPRPNDLNWGSSLLQNNFVPSIKAFLDIQNWDFPSGSSTALGEIPPIIPAPKWRSIPLNPQTHLQTGLSPFFAEASSPSIQSISFEEPYDRRGISFESDSDLTSTIWEATSDSTATVSSSKFFEHSFTFHETLLSSQIAPHPPQEDVSLLRTTGSFATTSFGSTTTDNSSVRALQEFYNFLPPGTISNPGHTSPNVTVTALSALPSPMHLLSIQPQTPTPNFLVALLSIPPPRTVMVRRTQKQMALYDIHVADETRASFSVTFWLPSSVISLHDPETTLQHSSKKANHHQEHLRETLEDLRIGDVVLLRNIALTAFRGTLYGQSLNPNISRARTSIDVLVRNGVDTPLVGQLGAELKGKIQSVRNWAGRYIAPGLGGGRLGADRGPRKKRKRDTGGNESGAEPETEDLPPDTQEG